MKVYIVQGDSEEGGGIRGVFADEADATELSKKLAMFNVSEIEVTPKQTPAFIPEGWTVEQTKSAIRVCQQQGIPFIWKEWLQFDGGEYIGRPNTNGMFIGIEQDGYAHT